MMFGQTFEGISYLVKHFNEIHYFCNVLILLIFNLQQPKKINEYEIFQSVTKKRVVRQREAYYKQYKQKFYHSGLSLIIKTFFVVSGPPIRGLCEK